jgi:hypothetical protein
VLSDLYNNIGLHLVFIGEDDEGLGGGAYDVYRVSEAMAGIDVGIATGVLATFLGADPIVVGGTPEQKHHWMSRIANEGLLVAYGATEPQAGSDLAQLKTKAVPVLNEDGTVKGYNITGRKQWISNGGVAEIYTILARAGRPLVVRGGEGCAGLQQEQAGGQARHPRQQHRRALPGRCLRRCRPADGRRRRPGPGAGAGRLRLHPLMVAAFGLGGGWAALKRAIKPTARPASRAAPRSTRSRATCTS